MLQTVTLISVVIVGSFAQITDPYLMYGGGTAMYGGMNPYLYSGGLGNYGAYNPASLLLSPYNMDMQSSMLSNYGNYNPMSGMSGYNSMSGMSGYNPINSMSGYNPMSAMSGYNPMNAYNSMNPALGANPMAGYTSSNVLDSGNTLNDASFRALRNRLPVMNRDGSLARLSGHSLFDCTGVLSSRPCPKRTVGAGTNWENTHDQS